MFVAVLLAESRRNPTLFEAFRKVSRLVGAPGTEELDAEMHCRLIRRARGLVEGQGLCATEAMAPETGAPWSPAVATFEDLL